MRCSPGNLVSLVVAAAIALGFLNILLFLVSSWVDRDVSSHDRPAPSLEKELQLWEMLQEAPPSLMPTESCPLLRMGQPMDGQFQTVMKDEVYVYSAFLHKDTIRVIALRRTRSGLALRCQVWYRHQGDEYGALTDAGVDNLPDHHDRRFEAASITCRLPPSSYNLLPLAVSVLVAGDSCPVVSNTVLVAPPGQMSSEFTVCVTPLHFRYSRAYELVEWIELNRLLGADKFVFYNHSTGPNVDKVLEMYRNQGIVDIQPWDLPVQTDTWPPTKKPEVHYFAQIASLNDCLHRYQNRSRYLVYQDLDEFIIPKSVHTWAELIQDREKTSGDISAFLFRCIFFRKEWPSPAKNFHTLAKMFHSVVLTYTRRESECQPPGVRSKYIINPRKTASIGVHQVWEASSRVDYVPEEVARLHHYRDWDKPTDTQPRVEDLLVAEKYGTRLVEQLQKAWSDLQGVPMDINITIYGALV